MKGFAAALAIAGLVSASAPARAGAPTDPSRVVAILGIEITGDGAPELRAQLEVSLAGGVATAGLQVVKLEHVLGALRDTPELIGCTSTTCLGRIGELVAAGRFLRARVEANGMSYVIELEYLSADVEGGVVARTEVRCDVCTLTEVNDRASSAARELVAGLIPVIVESNPPAGALRIDGKEVGASPWQGVLAPGAHRVVATLEGREPVEQAFTVVTGGELPVRLTVEVGPPVDLVEGGSRRPMRRWKWVAAGGTVAAFGAGVAMLAIDGNGTCDLSGAQRECPFVRDTGTLGIISLGAGVALGATAVWMFLRDGRDAARPADAGVGAMLVPTRGGALAGVTLRF